MTPDITEGMTSETGIQVTLCNLALASHIKTRRADLIRHKVATGKKRSSQTSACIVDAPSHRIVWTREEEDAITSMMADLSLSHHRRNSGFVSLLISAQEIALPAERHRRFSKGARNVHPRIKLAFERKKVEAMKMAGILTAYKSEVRKHVPALLPLGIDIHSVTIGWAIANGLSVSDAVEFAKSIGGKTF